MYDLTKTEISIKNVFTTETYQYCILKSPAYTTEILQSWNLLWHIHANLYI